MTFPSHPKQAALDGVECWLLECQISRLLFELYFDWHVHWKIGLQFMSHFRWQLAHFFHSRCVCSHRRMVYANIWQYLFETAIIRSTVFTDACTTASIFGVPLLHPEEFRLWRIRARFFFWCKWNLCRLLVHTFKKALLFLIRRQRGWLRCKWHFLILCFCAWESCRRIWCKGCRSIRSKSCDWAGWLDNLQRSIVA